MAGGGAMRLRGRAPASVTQLSVTMGIHSKQSISDALAAFVSAAPPGATFTLTAPDTSLAQVTTGERYVNGTNVIGAPGGSYDGTAGSGYGGSPPTDPGTSPAVSIQLVSVWRQAFTGTLYVLAHAHAPGGVDYVRLYVEGATLDVSDPVCFIDTDQKGREQWLHGMYVFEVPASNYTGFTTNDLRGIWIYLEGVAVDSGTIANRVIGGATNENERFIFFPVTALDVTQPEAPYDYFVTVDLSQPVAEISPTSNFPAVAANFHDVSDAIGYCGGSTRGTPPLSRNQTFLRPGIEIRSSATYSYTSNASFGQSGRGFCEVWCADGVTAVLGKDTWDPNTLNWRPGFQGVRLKGPRLSLDTTNWCNFEPRTGVSADSYRHWFDTIDSTATTDFSVYLDAGGNVRGLQNICPVGSFNTYCDLDFTAPASFIQWINLNNVRSGINSDYNNGTWYHAGELVYGMACTQFRVFYDAFTITYTGPDTPSIQKTGANGQTGNNFILLLNASPVLTVPTTNLLVSDLVAAINAHGAGWVAVSDVTSDDGITDRCSTFLQSINTTTQGAWTLAMTSAVPKQLYTFPDVHQDGYQNTVNPTDNISMLRTRIFDASGVQDFLNNLNMADCLIQDIAIDNVGAALNYYAQWPNSAALDRDFVNTQVIGWVDPGGGLILSNVRPGTSYDSLSMLVGYYGTAVNWDDQTAANATLQFTDCYFSSAVSVAGDVTTSFMTPVNCQAGGNAATNFPYKDTQYLILDDSAGTYQSGLQGVYDAQGVKRQASPVKGALAPGLPTGTVLTAAEMAELAVVTSGNTIGTNIAQLTISYTDVGYIYQALVNISVE